jgi:hypothetical protein
VLPVISMLLQKRYDFLTIQMIFTTWLTIPSGVLVVLGACHNSGNKLTNNPKTLCRDKRSQTIMYEVFYGTQYDLEVVRWYYPFFPMGTMVIWSMYIIWKIFLSPFTPSTLSPVTHITVCSNNIILHFR